MTHIKVQQKSQKKIVKSLSTTPPEDESARRKLSAVSGELSAISGQPEIGTRAGGPLQGHWTPG